MSIPNAATTLKQKAHELIDSLPEDATWQDLAEALAVVEDIEAGLGVDTDTLRRQYGLSK